MSRYQIASGIDRHLAGWRRELEDPRDKPLSPLLMASLEEKVLSLRVEAASYMPKIRDQGNIGSCTAHSGVAVAGFLYSKITGKPDPLFSPLDLYATTRELQGTPLSEDSGCQVRDVLKAMRRYGVCYEKTWPYDPTKFSVMPPREAMSEAQRHKAISYYKCPTLAAIKASLAAGYPVIGGFTCFSSMFTPTIERTGDIPYPAITDVQEGGHCVTFVGYDDIKDVLEFQNSWGPTWGDNGFGTLPYRFVTNKLSADFWTLRSQAIDG